MKVIKKGIVDGYVGKQFLCKSCNTLVEVEEGDWPAFISFNTGQDKSEYQISCWCPACGDKHNYGHYNGDFK